MPPCLYKSECLDVLRIPRFFEERTRVSGQTGNDEQSTGTAESCSIALRRAGCYATVSSQGPSRWKWMSPFFQRVACARLVPRSDCSCLPCYTECQPSSLCPQTTLPFAVGQRRALPMPPTDAGRYAFVLPLTFSWLSALAIEEQAPRRYWRHLDRPTRAWSNKFLVGVMQTIVSLRDVHAAYPIVVLASNVSSFALRPLRSINVTIIHVDFIANPTHMQSQGALKYPGTFGKLALWNLTQYDRVVSLDVDTIVRRNIDHLFSPAVKAPAAVAEGPPPRTFGGIHFKPFNSGVLVVSPDRQVFKSLVKAKDSLPSYDGGDQGTLASFHARRGVPWHELPRTYNLFGCPQEDEISAAHIWHANSNFQGGYKHPEYLRVNSRLRNEAKRLLGKLPLIS